MSFVPFIKTAIDYTRLENSKSGNPRYRITFKDGAVMDTANDASWAYIAESYEFYYHQCVWVVDGYGKVVHAQPIWGC